MTEIQTPTVEIPADVLHNSPHSIRIQWCGTRDAQPDEITSAKRHLKTFGYTLYEWDDVDQDGTRVTLHRFVDRGGHTVDLFATYYYTRVKCADCEYHWAQYYVSVDVPHGDGSAFPQCGEHAADVRRYQRRNPDAQVAFSEPLNPGQH